MKLYWAFLCYNHFVIIVILLPFVLFNILCYNYCITSTLDGRHSRFKIKKC